jgi:hypothetical protein
MENLIVADIKNTLERIRLHLGNPADLKILTFGRPESEFAVLYFEGLVNETRLAEQIENPTLIAGELSAEDRARLGRKRANVLLAPPVRCIRRPSILADLAWTRWKKNEIDNPAALAPLYLRVEGAPNA